MCDGVRVAQRCPAPRTIDVMGSKERLTRNGDSSLTRTWDTTAAALVLLLFGSLSLQYVEADKHPEERANWVNHGGDLLNSRSATCEHKISTKSVRNLSLKWEFIAGADVTATPAISDGVVYFPSWNGNIYALQQDTGALVWQRNFTLLAGVTTRARTTPMIYEDYLLIGIYGPGRTLAMNKTTGDLLWSTTLSEHPSAIITMSGTAFEGFYYIGTSSTEEAVTVNCCTFQGAFFKLKVSTGEIMWSVPMLPDNGGQIGGYAGVGLWGSSPPIDVKRRAIYVATGNAYSVPPNVTACEVAWRNLTNPPTPDPCLVPDNHQESMLSIDINSGKVNWARKLGGFDTWIYVCVLVPDSPNCPAFLGPDYDFGEAPMLVRVPDPSAPGRMKEILVVAQKSGIVWGVDAANGSILWATEAGPGGFLGGGTWGMTHDGEKVFTNIVNNNLLNFTLVPSTKVVHTGGWVALEATTGKVIWSVGNPFGNWTYTPLTHANGVVFAGSTTPEGHLLALDSKTGKILFSTKTNGSLSGGLSISNGCGFVGIGVPPALAIAPTLTHGFGVNSYCVD